MKKHNLAFVDVETTGFDPIKNEIIELGAIIVRQVPGENGRGPKLEIIHELEYKVKPRRLETADPQALRINGYNEGDWLFAADLEQVMKDFAEKTAGATFVAHNMAFDLRFIDQAFVESGVENKMHYGKLDTISIAFARLYHHEKAQAFSLGALSELLGITNSKAHTALADARATMEVYKKLLEI
ncbi:MAG: polymerase subunit epsilon [Patescibacteria group bacterium]|nr:polymerase subunit epsilon [Patescibacteria group bacterium]